MIGQGRVLVQVMTLDFASTNINNITFTQLLASLPDDVVRLDVTNTASDSVIIGAGAAGIEVAAAVIGQAATLSIPCFMNKFQRVALKSVFTATVSSGKLTIAAYK